MQTSVALGTSMSELRMKLGYGLSFGRNRAGEVVMDVLPKEDDPDPLCMFKHPRIWMTVVEAKAVVRALEDQIALVNDH